MKKIFSLILAAVLPMVANAYDIAVANDDGVTIYYNYINNGTELEVTSGNYSGSIVIPEEVTYMKRTRKITGIGNYAFYGCIGLTSVTISNSVTRIGDYAFWECDVPEIISRIENPFSISTNTFTDYTFNNATLYIPAGTKDKYKATEGWKKFIIIVDGNGAADGDILSGWSEEGYQFKMQVISEKEKTASLYGYYKTNYGGIPCIDDKITGVITIPAQSEGYKIIGVSNDAFAGCAKLTEVVLPEGIQTFGFDAFAGCYALEKIKIPSTVTDMYNSNIFRSCRSLKVIEVAEGNKYYDSRNNCNAIIKKDGNVLVTGCFNTIIPDGVVEIGNSAFSGQTNLHEISLPSSVKTLNENAFASTSLSSIDLSNIKTIGFGIFQNCKNLMEVKFGEELEVIGGYAFYNCTGLTSVTIPNSVTSIGNGAFCYCI